MRCIILKLTLAVVLFLWGAAARAAEPPVYTIGVVPQFELRRMQAIWGPIIERLQAATGLRFRLTLDRDIPAFETSLHAGAFDIAYMNPLHYVIANRRQGYRAVVRDLDGGLYGIVVVRKDSPITAPSMLNGRMVAFPSPNAMGAALLPRAELVRKYGISIQETYVKSHTSSYMNVLMGQAEAAGGVMATFEQQPPEIRNGLRILYETERYMPHPVAIHPRVAAEPAATIQAALLALADEAAGRALLAEIPIKRLGRAEDRDYDSLRRLGLEAFYVE